MKSDFLYDLVIIGGGISACVFASKYLKNNITKKIALIEIGRGLGGRSSTRISKRFKGWKLNHGSPNFNIRNNRNNLLLKNYINQLLENKFIQKTNFCISLCSIISYFLFDKTIALLFQVVISILLIINWQRVFKDWLFILYPIFGIFFTTFFGTRLSISGDQFWHVLIGPSGTISVLTFYLVLKRSDKKFT